MNIIDEIRRLKKERQALVLAHYYQDSEIQDIADHIGDSLQLAQIGQASSAPVIVLAGVVFMGESVKILSPNKTVLVPDLSAGCSLVELSPADRFRAWREQHPEGIAVTYINSSAQVKALSDVCVTSSNAEKIIQAIPADRTILFAPDAQLGRYLSHKLKRPMLLWPGSCEVHVLFSTRELFLLRQEYPNALVLAHPECSDTILVQADVIGSTSRLLQEVATNKSVTEFIVATEPGILHQMRKARPDALLLEAPSEATCGCNQCPHMKLNSLEKVRNALRDLRPQVYISSEYIEKARLPLDRMMAITTGSEFKPWPNYFQSF